MSTTQHTPGRTAPDTEKELWHLACKLEKQNAGICRGDRFPRAHRVHLISLHRVRDRLTLLSIFHPMNTKIDSLTIAEAREIAALFQRSSLPAIAEPVNTSPYEIGKTYLIRTVSMIDTGRVVEVGPLEIVLEDAAWIADTGRFADALKSGDFSEVEPFPDGRVIINRSAVIDAVRIPKTQRSQK